MNTFTFRLRNSYNDLKTTASGLRVVDTPDAYELLLPDGVVALHVPKSELVYWSREIAQPRTVIVGEPGPKRSFWERLFG